MSNGNVGALRRGLPEILGEEGAWDPRSCPWCGASRPKPGPELNGTRPYSCRECGRSWEAALKDGQPVSRVLTGTREDTRGFRCGDAAEIDRYNVPRALPCGCRLRAPNGSMSNGRGRVTHPRLANGDRICTRHKKRFRLVLIFEEARR